MNDRPQTTPQSILPEGTYSEPNSLARARAEAATKTPLHQSVQVVTDAINGAVFGKLGDYNAGLEYGITTSTQEAAFRNGGKALVEELTRNLSLQRRFGASATQPGTLDLDRDGQISGNEYAAMAAVLDEKMTARAGTLGIVGATDSIVTELGSAADIRRAGQVLSALNAADAMGAPSAPAATPSEPAVNRAPATGR